MVERFMLTFLSSSFVLDPNTVHYLQKRRSIPFIPFAREVAIYRHPFNWFLSLFLFFFYNGKSCLWASFEIRILVDVYPGWCLAITSWWRSQQCLVVPLWSCTSCGRMVTSLGQVKRSLYNGSGKGEEGGRRESFHTHTLKHVAACLSLGGQQHIGMASGDDMLTYIYILWMLHLAIIILGHLTLSISV